MNWFDKRHLLRPLGLLSAMAALAAVTALALCPAQAAEEKEKDEKPKTEKKEKGGKDSSKKGDKDKGKEGKDKKRKKKKDKDKESDVAEIIPIPIGHGAEGIKIPHRDGEGRLQMNFQIGSAFREDETNLKMENLKIETFDVRGNLDMVVEMPKSVMNMKTRVLTSNDPIQIQRQDFKIVGGNVTFHTQTRFGTFKGPVRMLIFNRDF